jgi:hypothetical protein
MVPTLFELIRVENGIIVPDYRFLNWIEFQNKIEKPAINFMHYGRGAFPENFVQNKIIEHFDNLFKLGINSLDVKVYESMFNMRENIQENIKNSKVDFFYLDNANKLVNEVKNLPQNEYITLNVKKINKDLMQIYSFKILDEGDF